jgi:hypothetical protein
MVPRACWLLFVAACKFTHGEGHQGDALVVPIDSDEPDGMTQMTDGSMADAAMVIADAPTDGPIVSTCGTANFTCAGSAVAINCNGGCWIKCTQGAPIANQAAAATACANWGGKLAPLRTQADENCVAQTLFPSQAHWIGLEQAGNASSVAGSWTWNSDGMALSFTGWGTGQPNDINGNENDHAEQCAFMNTSGDWHDTPCSDGGLYRFSCRQN